MASSHDSGTSGRGRSSSSGSSGSSGGDEGAPSRFHPGRGRRLVAMPGSEGSGSLAMSVAMSGAGTGTGTGGGTSVGTGGGVGAGASIAGRASPLAPRFRGLGGGAGGGGGGGGGASAPVLAYGGAAPSLWGLRWRVPRLSTCMYWMAVAVLTALAGASVSWSLRDMHATAASTTMTVQSKGLTPAIMGPSVDAVVAAVMAKLLDDRGVENVALQTYVSRLAQQEVWGVDVKLRQLSNAVQDRLAALEAAVQQGAPLAAPAVVRPVAAVSAPPPSPQEPPLPSLAAVPPAPMLVIGIPTVRRKEEEPYLTQTLEYIARELGGDSIGAARVGDAGTGNVAGDTPLRVRVVVMCNTRPPALHAAWVAAVAAVCTPAAAVAASFQGALAAGPDGVATWAAGNAALGACRVQRVAGTGGSHVVLVAAASPFLFALNGVAPIDDGTDYGDANTPGAKVRAQTRDVVQVMAVAAGVYGREAAYYMFQEDDFRLCPHGGEALAYLLAKATIVAPDWNAIRVSFGLNGAIIRMADVPVLAAYYTEHVARRPPDHLTVEWFAGERPQSAIAKRGRPHVAFRYNLLEHFGYASSLRGKATPHYAVCYQELNEDVVFEVESFRQSCKATDMWPCPPGIDPARLPRIGIDFGVRQSLGRSDTVQTWKDPNAVDEDK